MCDARQDQLVDIFEKRVEGLAVGWRVHRQRRANLTGLHLRQHRKGFNPRLVVGDPVDHGMAVAAELVGGHVKRFFLGHGEPLGTANANRASPKQAFLREPSWPLWLLLSLAPTTTKASKVNAGLVIEGYAPTRRVLLKNPPQFEQHGFVLRMSRPRRV